MKSFHISFLFILILGVILSGCHSQLPFIHTIEIERSDQAVVGNRGYVYSKKPIPQKPRPQKEYRQLVEIDLTQLGPNKE